jgi:hypothetical protein
MNGVSLADLANEIVAMAKPSGRAGKATGLWQDKRPHIAARTVGCFDWVFWPSAHIVNVRRDVPASESTFFINDNRTSHRNF